MPKTSAFILALLIASCFAIPVLASVYGASFCVLAAGYTQVPSWHSLPLLAAGTVLLARQSLHGLLFFLLVLVFLVPATVCLLLEGKSLALNAVMCVHVVATMSYTWSQRMHFQ